MNKKTCLTCGTPILGRIDKRFCDAQCRATENNKRKRDTEAYLQSINSILRKNRGILKSINPQGHSTIREQYLRDQGFDFRYFTTYYKTQKGLSYYFCYEFGFSRIDKEKIVVVNWQDYMDRFPNVMPELGNEGISPP